MGLLFKCIFLPHGEISSSVPEWATHPQNIVKMCPFMLLPRCYLHLQLQAVVSQTPLHCSERLVFTLLIGHQQYSVFSVFPSPTIHSKLQCIFVAMVNSKVALMALLTHSSTEYLPLYLSLPVSPLGLVLSRLTPRCCPDVLFCLSVR